MTLERVRALQGAASTLILALLLGSGALAAWPEGVRIALAFLVLVLLPGDELFVLLAGGGHGAFAIRDGAVAACEIFLRPIERRLAIAQRGVTLVERLFDRVQLLAVFARLLLGVAE